MRGSYKPPSGIKCHEAHARMHACALPPATTRKAYTAARIWIPCKQNNVSCHLQHAWLSAYMTELNQAYGTCNLPTQWIQKLEDLRPVTHMVNAHSSEAQARHDVQHLFLEVGLKMPS